MEWLDREAEAAKATVVVVIQTPGSGSRERGVVGEGGSERQEVEYCGGRDDAKRGNFIKSAYKFLVLFIKIFIFIHLFITY